MKKIYLISVNPVINGVLTPFDASRISVIEYDAFLKKFASRFFESTLNRLIASRLNEDVIYYEAQRNAKKAGYFVRFDYANALQIVENKKRAYMF